MNRRALLGAGVTLLAGCRAKRSAPFPGYAFVANYDAKTVAVVDLAAFAVAKQIHLDDSPAALALHPTKNRVYVLTPGSGVLYEIDGTKMAVSRKTRVAGSALSMRMSPSHEEPAAWVLAADRRLIRVDVETMRTEGQIALPGQPTDFDISMYKRRAAVAYRDSGSAAIVDLKEGKAGPAVRVSDQVGSVRFRSDGDVLIVADLANRSLTLLQAPSGRIMSRLPLAVRPDHLCFNQNGGQLFITGEGRDAVVIVYPYNVPEVAETVLAGRAPGAMAASTGFLFIASPTTGDVNIFDIATHKTIAVTAVGAEPGYIAITPDDQYALVLNRKSGDLAVIRIAAVKSDWAYKSKAAALFAMIPVGSKPVAAVVRAV
jgi:DNA-binding beta-propeller fold protein YncE